MVLSILHKCGLAHAHVLARVSFVDAGVVVYTLVDFKTYGVAFVILFLCDSVTSDLIYYETMHIDMCHFSQFECYLLTSHCTFRHLR